MEIKKSARRAYPPQEQAQVPPEAQTGPQPQAEAQTETPAQPQVAPQMEPQPELPTQAQAQPAPPAAGLPGGAQPQAAPLANIWTLAGAWVLAALYWHMLLAEPRLPPLQLGGQRFYWVYAAFTLVWAAAVLAAGRLGGRRAGEGPFWLGCALAAGVGLGLPAAVPSRWTMLGFWHGAAAYGALACTGQLGGGRTGAGCLADALRGVAQGFAGLLDWPRQMLLRLAASRRRGGRGRRAATAGFLVVGAALLVWAAVLLGRADETFGAALQALVVPWRPQWLYGRLGYLLLELPTAGFLFGLVVTGARRASGGVHHPQLQALGRGLRGVGEGVLCAVVAAFVGLYLVFFCVQGRLVFGVFTGVPPQNFTVAGYARQGFFELCRVMGINLGLTALCHAASARPLWQARRLRRAVAVLLGQSLLLWLTAAAKLGLYIGVFGFTPRRLLAAWALLVLAVAALRTLVWLWRRCSVVRPTVLTGAAAFAVLCLV